MVSDIMGEQILLFKSQKKKGQSAHFCRFIKNTVATKVWNLFTKLSFSIKPTRPPYRVKVDKLSFYAQTNRFRQNA